MHKRAIPKVPVGEPQRIAFDSAIKENLEVLIGFRIGKIAKLKDGATLQDIVDKLNEVIERLQ